VYFKRREEGRKGGRKGGRRGVNLGLYKGKGRREKNNKE
jgi:hypothetical protein